MIKTTRPCLFAFFKISKPRSLDLLIVSCLFPSYGLLLFILWRRGTAVYPRRQVIGTEEAAPLVVVYGMDGERWYTLTKQFQEISLQVAEAVRKVLWGKNARGRQHLPLLPMVIVDDARPASIKGSDGP